MISTGVEGPAALMRIPLSLVITRTLPTEAPATNIEEIVKESEKLEVESITNNTIEFKDGFKVEDASKIETWIYPETEFYGYNEVDESKIIKEIVLDKDILDDDYRDLVGYLPQDIGFYKITALVDNAFKEFNL